LKTFDEFDFAFQPSIDERQIRELRTLRFVHEASNVILLGPPGLGKTHLAVALAEASIQSGQAAYFMTAHDLVTDLGRAYREGRLDRRLRIYLAPKVLVIDEMGYLPLDELGATIFFQLVSARYERGSITSLRTRVTANGVRFSATQSSPPRSSTGCFTGTATGRCCRWRSELSRQREPFVMSFSRHGQIYQSDALFRPRSEVIAGFAPGLIVLMSLRPAIPRQVGLHQSPPPLHRLKIILIPSAETVNHHLAGAGDFSTGEMRNFQPALTFCRLLAFLVTC
jgi:hypothetical protein